MIYRNRRHLKLGIQWTRLITSPLYLIYLFRSSWIYFFFWLTLSVRVPNSANRSEHKIRIVIPWAPKYHRLIARNKGGYRMWIKKQKKNRNINSNEMLVAEEKLPALRLAKIQDLVRNKLARSSSGLTVAVWCIPGALLASCALN